MSLLSLKNADTHGSQHRGECKSIQAGGLISLLGTPDLLNKQDETHNRGLSGYYGIPCFHEIETGLGRETSDIQ